METQAAVLCPKCGFQQRESFECIKCGIVFAKFDPARHLPSFNDASDNTVSLSEAARIEESTDSWLHGSGKYALIALMGFFFFYMVIKRSGWCFLDYINLPFHEFGHILFTPFGRTMHFLGGTISQLMWPFILLLYFTYRKEYLSSSFCLFWFGENFLNISKYMADARDLNLPLVGGGIHDWNYLFYRWGVLHLDKTVAGVIFTIGVIIMTGSMIWAVISSLNDSRENNA